MRRDPEWSEEFTFLKKLKEAAAFYIKHNAQKNFAELIASIPTAGKPLKNNKKCINTSEKKSEGNRKRTQHKNKHENKSESKKTRCILCKKKYVRIKGHYRSLHKIDDDFWIKNVTDKDVQRNGTTCPICEIDHNNIKSLREHLIDYHNIKLLAKNIKDTKGQTRVVGETATPKEREPMVNDPAVQEERETTEDYPITQNRQMTEPAVQDGQIKRNANVQDKREKVMIHDVQKLCKHCNKFVNVSSIDSHIASHQRERETFAFKTSYPNQNAASSQCGNASHSYETTENIESRKQGENETVAHSNNDEEQSRMMDNETEGSSIQNVEQFQTTRDSQEDVGIDNSRQDHANDISEDIIPQNMRNNEEQRQAQEDVRKSRFKLLWKEYYRRMLVANENGKKELYDKFLNEYASLGNRGVVCHRRSNFGSVDAKRRQRRVDAVSMITMETLTSCQSGVSFTQKRITYLLKDYKV